VTPRRGFEDGVNGYFPRRRAIRACCDTTGGKAMGITTSIIVFAVGAILRFATSVQSTNFNVHTIGVILMIVGVVGFVISIVFWASWGGFGGSHASRRTTVYRREPGQTSVEERQQSVP
jgi:hypothetical protein